MNILREPSRTYTASYEPPLEFMSLHSIMATCVHKWKTYSDSSWDVGRVKVNKLLDISPTLLDRIIGSGNKKQKNTEGDWIGDQGSHTEILSLFFNKSSSQFSIPFLPQQDRNRNYKAEHTQLIIHSHF